jgi:hypothetical protein
MARETTRDAGRGSVIVHLHAALHAPTCRGRHGPPREGGQQCLGGFAADDRVSYGVGVLLVQISDFADATLQGNAASLLNDVGGLVCGRVQIRAVAEGNLLTGRERGGPMSRVAWDAA